MLVYDIVQIVGSGSHASYPANSRTLIEFKTDRGSAESRCDMFNACKHDRVEDYQLRYEVEEHDEESSLRAMPVR